MLKTLIKGAGHECIFLLKFHCELNPIEMVSNRLLGLTNSADHCIQYWGWCIYRYREHPKANFAAAKERALQVLDACPVEVIRWFINHSGWFVEAYQSGLTGKAAAWAVKKQKQHCAVSEREGYGCNGECKYTYLVCVQDCPNFGGPQKCVGNLRKNHFLVLPAPLSSNLRSVWINFLSFGHHKKCGL
jgi:hypothetical protein